MSIKVFQIQWLCSTGEIFLTSKLNFVVYLSRVNYCKWQSTIRINKKEALGALLKIGGQHIDHFVSKIVIFDDVITFSACILIRSLYSLSSSYQC